MNYHLMIDNKFIDKFIDSAEMVAPGKNVYIFTFMAPTEFVKSKKGIFALPFSNEFNLLINGINENDRLYIHWFEKYITKVIKNIPQKVPVYLFFWGGDFLSQTDELNNFNFDELSKKYLDRNKKKLLLYFPRNPIGYLRNIKRYLVQQRERRTNEELEKNARIEFLARLTYFCHWNILDMKLVTESYGGKPFFQNFIYDVSLDKIERPIAVRNRNDGPLNILLGNSDTPSNNHLDAFKSLKKYRAEDLKLFCPLNYGHEDYREYVRKKGLKFFKEKWFPLTEFMPIDSYLGMLNSIDVVVMYHNRSQAAGNIFALIKMGKKVYLKKQSTIYSLMVENGIKVFDAVTIKDLSFKEFSKPLSLSEVEENYSEISRMFSRAKRLADLEIILN